MKTRKLLYQVMFIVSLSCLFINTGCNNAAPEEAKEATAEVTAKNEAFMKAYNNGNISELTIQYTKTARLHPPNDKEIQGTLAISEFWQSQKNNGMDKIELETSSAQRVGNSLNEIGTYKLYSSTGQLVDAGKYIVIWEKMGDEWKVQEDIWNSSMPVPVVKAKEPVDTTTS